MFEKHEAIKSRFEQRIDEIDALKIKKRIRVDQWHFTQADTLFPPTSGWKPCLRGHLWDNTGEKPVWFETQVQIPQRREHESIFFNAWFGGESMLFVDGKPFGELNPYHQQVNVNAYTDNHTHTLSVQVVPHLLFGEKSQKRQMDHSHLLIIDERISQFVHQLKITLETAFYTKDSLLSERLFLLLEKVLSRTQIPRNSEIYTDSLMDNPSLSQYIQKKYISETLDYSQGHLFSSDFSDKLELAQKELTESLKALCKDFPSLGTLSAVGHAHIDYAWLWPISETKRKIPRTFSNAIQMCGRYDHFIFAQSSAQMYKDIAEDYPEIMSQIKELQKKGQWEPVGGAWVEHDCNIPSPESLIRQVYYGQKFFKELFGSYNKVAWLPDVFGFPWTLPQILKDAGMDYFFTTKLTWNEKNPFPHDVMIWRGLDGSEVLYRSFKNHEGYNARLNPQTLFENWNQYREKAKIPLGFITFGYGDGGGGPSDEMMENYQHLQTMPGLPKVEIMTAHDHFEKTREAVDQMETWDDELYLEFHRGCYTTQARTKKLHKKAEDSLIQLEMMQSILKESSECPPESLVSVTADKNEVNVLWQTLLKNEFHDILPGSSISQVYERAEQELGDVCLQAGNHLSNLLDENATDQGEYLSIFNPCEYERHTTFQLKLPDAWLLKGPNGETLVPYQTHNGHFLYHYTQPIRPFSTFVFHKEKIVQAVQEVTDHSLTTETPFYQAHITNTGAIQVYDKVSQRFLFKDSGNHLKMYEDVPMFWDAWDIACHYESYECPLSPCNLNVIESNAIRKVIQVTYRVDDTQMIQRYLFNYYDQTITVENEIDWHHRRMLLKAEFDTTVLCRRAAFDLGAGYIFRNTHKNTDMEKARFEVPGHRWVDLSERDFGVAILNDCKYGYSSNQSEVALTLLRSPINPMVFADEGKHRFSYAIRSHLGSDLLPTIQSARKLNRKLLAYNGKIDKLEHFGLSFAVDHLHLMCLKRDEKGRLVLRISEVAGSRGTTQVQINGIDIQEVYRANLLEEILEKLPILSNNSFELKYEPFKIYTLIIS